jgi:predicted nuclease with TOPRIM domain
MMAELERRKHDRESKEEILRKLGETNEYLSILDKGQTEIKIKQDNIISRLDKVNGTVADYNEKKYKIDEAHLKVKTLEAQTLSVSKLLTETALINKNLILEKDLQAEKKHSEMYQFIDKNYVSVKSMTTILNTLKVIGTILTLVVTGSTVITILKSCDMLVGG